MEDIFKAISNGQDEWLQSLLSTLKDVNQPIETNEHFTIAHHAASVGTCSIVKQVLALESIDLTIKDDSGKSPLHIAVLKNKSRDESASIVHLFLAAHANVSAVDNNRQTPLHIAMLNKDIQSVRELVESDAPTDVLDNTSSSPTMMSEDLGSEFKFYMNVRPASSFVHCKTHRYTPKEALALVEKAWIEQLSDL